MLTVRIILTFPPGLGTLLLQCLQTIATRPTHIFNPSLIMNSMVLPMWCCITGLVFAFSGISLWSLDDDYEKTAQQVVQLAMMSHGYLSMEEILVSQHSSFTRRVVRCVNNSRFGMLRIAKVLRLLSLSVIYLTFISTITLLGILSQYVNHFILLSNIDFLNFFF